MTTDFHGEMFNPGSGRPRPQGLAEVGMHMQGIDDRTIDRAIMDIEIDFKLSSTRTIDAFSRAAVLEQRVADGDTDGGLEGDFGTDHAPRRCSPSGGCLGAMVEVEIIRDPTGKHERQHQYPKILDLIPA